MTTSATVVDFFRIEFISGGIGPCPLDSVLLLLGDLDSLQVSRGVKFSSLELSSASESPEADSYAVSESLQSVEASKAFLFRTWEGDIIASVPGRDSKFWLEKDSSCFSLCLRLDDLRLRFFFCFFSWTVEDELP